MNHEEIKRRLLENIRKEPKPEGPLYEHVEGDCWLWQGYITSEGYGQFPAKKIHDRRAHRLSHEVFIGPIPEGLSVLHRCDIRHCVRPEHLYVGTDQDNADDRVARDRQPKGENHGRATLTEAEVRWIKYWLYQEIYPQSLIAERYGVNEIAIHHISGERSWPHVEMENPEDCPPELWPPEARWPLALEETRRE